MRFLLVVLLSFSLVSPLSMQTPEEPSVTCDYTLITLMLVAMRDYGYIPPLPFDQYSIGMYADQPTGDETDSPTVREDVENAVNQAAAEAGESGFPGVADALSGLAEGAGDLAEAGQDLFEAGREAFEAGRSSLEGEVSETGVIPGESDECTALRESLLAFFFANLTRAEPSDESE